jgi:hypothetical protein
MEIMNQVIVGGLADQSKITIRGAIDISLLRKKGKR